MPRITPHTYRHDFCTTYLSRGGDIGRLKQITGHSSYDMLQNYLQAAKVASVVAHEELERINPLKKL
jgi:integrase